MYDSADDISATRPVVYVGPSLDPRLVRSHLPHAVILPPAQREDIYTASARGASLVALIDGRFAHRFAVSPREIVDVLREGVKVYGAASMGALRAVDCHPAGMIGVGLIYRLFKLGVLNSDDEVAVATSAEPPHAARSDALVSIRYSLRRAVIRGAISRNQENDLVDAARATHFSERDFGSLFDKHPDLRSACPFINLKAIDAMRMVALIGRVTADCATIEPRPPRAVVRRERYTGHDRYVGLPPADVRVAVTRWIWGSGRYQRYLWPLLLATPNAATLIMAGNSPLTLRSSAAKSMRNALSDIDSLSAAVFRELDFLGETDAEITRWYAINCLSGTPAHAPGPDASVLSDIRNRVAVMHGFRNWESLLRRLDSDRLLWGAIPFDWINQSADKWALARSAHLHRRRHAENFQVGGSDPYGDRHI